MVSCISGNPDSFYTITYSNLQNTNSRIGFFSNGTKISNLCNLFLDFKATIMAMIPFEDNIVIGGDDGKLNFYNKDGFEDKGWSHVHRSPIRAILSNENFFVVVDQKANISIWKILSEKESYEKRENYKKVLQSGGFKSHDQQMGGGFGGGGFGGGGFGGGSFGGNQNYGQGNFGGGGIFGGGGMN
jgi:hypothetical protein